MFLVLAVLVVKKKKNTNSNKQPHEVQKTMNTPKIKEMSKIKDSKNKKTKSIGRRQFTQVQLQKACNTSEPKYTICKNPKMSKFQANSKKQN